VLLPHHHFLLDQFYPEKLIMQRLILVLLTRICFGFFGCGVWGLGGGGGVNLYLITDKQQIKNI